MEEQEKEINYLSVYIIVGFVILLIIILLIVFITDFYYTQIKEEACRSYCMGAYDFEIRNNPKLVNNEICVCYYPDKIKIFKLR